MAHEPRGTSPHGRDRICTNDALSGAGSSGPYPVGAAAVKELVDSAGNVVGYTVSLKARPDPAPTIGSNWYWYRTTPFGSGPIGFGEAECVGCHALAADATPAGRDLVFTQVP
jgi:hypothetical protein